jgi:hypothetical protein
VDRVYPSEALVKMRGKKHKAMADQLTTVSKTRLQNRVGRLSETDMQAVEQASRCNWIFRSWRRTLPRISGTPLRALPRRGVLADTTSSA